MEQKSYSVAIPFSLSSKKQYQIKASTRNLNLTSYNLRLNVISPFIEKEKDYPIKLAAFSRYPATMDEEVYEVAERQIKSVDTVLSQYILGTGRIEEKGAVIHEDAISTVDRIRDGLLDSFTFSSRSQIAITTFIAENFIGSVRGVDYFISLLESELGLRANDLKELHTLESYKEALVKRERSLELVDDNLGNKVIKVIDSRVLEDANATRLLKLNYGSTLIDGLLADMVHNTYDLQLWESEAVKVVNKLLWVKLEEFDYGKNDGKPTYLHDLIASSRVRQYFDLNLEYIDPFDRFKTVDFNILEVEEFIQSREELDSLIDIALEGRRTTEYLTSYSTELIESFDFEIVKPVYSTELYTSYDFNLRHTELDTVIEEVPNIGGTHDYEMVIYEMLESTQHSDSHSIDIYEIFESTRRDLHSTNIYTTDMFERRDTFDTNQPEEIHWFTRVEKHMVIDELDWFTRTIRDMNIIETTMANREMVYNSSIEEFINFDGPDYKSYTWLWHSRPSWWNKWNWRKTK